MNNIVIINNYEINKGGLIGSIISFFFIVLILSFLQWIFDETLNIGPFLSYVLGMMPYIIIAVVAFSILYLLFNLIYKLLDLIPNFSGSEVIYKILLSLAGITALAFIYFHGFGYKSFAWQDYGNRNNYTQSVVINIKTNNKLDILDTNYRIYYKTETGWLDEPLEKNDIIHAKKTGNNIAFKVPESVKGIKIVYETEYTKKDITAIFNSEFDAEAKTDLIHYPLENNSITQGKKIKIHDAYILVLDKATKTLIQKDLATIQKEK